MLYYALVFLILGLLANLLGARERGAAIAGKAAEMVSGVEETVAEAAISSKIKAKMALDDSVRAVRISVTTQGSTVTLSGRCRA